MRAAFIERTGPAESMQVGTLSDPVPGPGQVLVRVGASAVNPIDTYIRSGAVGMAQKFPYIPGCDLAGTVDAVGPGVQTFQPGDRVWGSNQSLFGRQGTLSELAAVDQQWLYPLPVEESFVEAAAGALTGITAHLGLFLHARLAPGEWVFVNGGTGGVGSAVVQLAKAAGAHVIATVGSTDKATLCRQLGADLVLDYRSESMDQELKDYTAARGGVDIWWETQREPNFDRSFAFMRPRGRMVLMAGRDARPVFPVGPFYVRELRLVGFAMFNATADEQRQSADDINRWFASGKWRPIVGQTFPLDEAAAAHKLQEDNTIGKQGTLTGKIVVVP
ncbi:MAG: NADPH:quinone reductase [Planctomycetaceae bacterium]|nr:NADPH:quinone reductase [Planctomycetaceae bacterium]